MIAAAVASLPAELTECAEVDPIQSDSTGVASEEAAFRTKDTTQCFDKTENGDVVRAWWDASTRRHAALVDRHATPELGRGGQPALQRLDALQGALPQGAPDRP